MVLKNRNIYTGATDAERVEFAPGLDGNIMFKHLPPTPLAAVVACVVRTAPQLLQQQVLLYTRSIGSGTSTPRCTAPVRRASGAALHVRFSLLCV